MDSIALYIIVGFFAQMIDGALGMAYGVSSTSFLLSVGVSPAAASASVHIAEVFTTGISGLSHWKFKNVSKEFLKKLIIPGIIGGVLGAYLLSNIPGNTLKPFVSIYLIVMGIRILLKAFSKNDVLKKLENMKVSILGIIGGFFDAIGGGGWGPIVTSTLVSNGGHPRYVIGTVNLAEFFVTVAEAATFITLIGLAEFWQIILGLAIGGAIAAPLAAYICSRIPVKKMMIVVGCVIILLNIRSLWILFF